MNETINDNDGNPFAWAWHGDSCANTRCKRAMRANRPYHVISIDTDKDYHLVLPETHYASVDEGVKAIENAINTAETVDNPTDRDAAYKRGVPVKILKNTGNF